jgi:hypothetical protein
MTTKLYTTTEKDTILREAFERLANLGISAKWAKSTKPYTELREECGRLMKDADFVKDLEAYLQTHIVLSRASEMFATYIAMAARAKWYEVPGDIRPITARGWFLGRWIPTFLIIDGPIGRFLCKGSSPLYLILKDEYRRYPLLASARDFLSNDLFRRLRNGFGHWSFDWEVVGTESYFVTYDWKTGARTAKLHQEEADAFHIITYGLIEILDDMLISQRNSVEVAA